MTTADPYDQVAYVSTPVRASHPPHLTTIARVHGLEVPELETARVLELGCATGVNLMSLAQQFPRASFHGVDLSAQQIATGQSLAARAGLENLKLEHRSIADIGPADGPYDFIIAHGVYSWVPPDIQEKLLAICATNLSPRGLAYVSYNCFPGWHQRLVVRDLMGYRGARFEDPRERVAEARAALERIAGAADADDPYGRSLKNQATTLKSARDDYILHEYLEIDNSPVYFHQFVSKAAASGLRFVAEATFPTGSALLVTGELRAAIEPMARDIIEQEQYVDFIHNRAFRRTILCRDDRTVSRRVTPERLRGMLLSTDFEPQATEGRLTMFIDPSGAKFQSVDPRLTLALTRLSSYFPRTLRFESLVDYVVRQTPGAQAASARAPVEALLLGAYLHGALECRTVEPAQAWEVSERPLGASLARAQARDGALVTTLRHYATKLDDFERALLGALDGKTTIEALQRDERLRAAAPQGESGAVRAGLERLLRLGLLSA
ncbi:MAG: class I SAM-dependent methyltransferase [Polyangiaceae bacterium]